MLRTVTFIARRSKKEGSFKKKPSARKKSGFITIPRLPAHRRSDTLCF